MHRGDRTVTIPLMLMAEGSGRMASSFYALDNPWWPQHGLPAFEHYPLPSPSPAPSRQQPTCPAQSPGMQSHLPDPHPFCLIKTQDAATLQLSIPHPLLKEAFLPTSQGSPDMSGHPVLLLWSPCPIATE